jgi:hypothetical protein
MQLVLYRLLVSCHAGFPVESAPAHLGIILYIPLYSLSSASKEETYGLQVNLATGKGLFDLSAICKRVAHYLGIFEPPVAAPPVAAVAAPPVHSDAEIVLMVASDAEIDLMIANLKAEKENRSRTATAAAPANPPSNGTQG